MAKHGKSYNAAAEKIDRATLYTPLQAAKLIKELDTAKFDETVEAHFRLGIDTRKADQNIRGSISLPHGTGKTVRVAVFAEGEKAREAEAAGADIIGSDELVAQIQKGEINFDAAIATPNMMAKVGRIGKILGPRGLMPNPKLGTVTMDVAKMVSELKAGRVEYRADRYGICHVVKLLEYITYKYRYRKVKYHLHWFPNCHVCLHSKTLHFSASLNLLCATHDRAFLMYQSDYS
mgnify:CR=1 FL=1